MLVKGKEYKELLAAISDAYLLGRVNALRAVNIQLLKTNWEIGQYIVEFEQGGKFKAEYGKALLERLSKDLTIQHGKGFSMSNLSRIRQLYLVFPILAEVPQELTWSHVVELLKIGDPLERNFYQNQAIKENWSTTELIRQKKSSLFLRLAATKDKAGIIELSKKGQVIEKPTDILRDTYVFEFLKIPEPYHLTESDLENRLIGQLQESLLELGKGFAFIGRQYRITLGNRPHYVDLVFYHRILKCFILIDLKREEADYQDVGQMNMYLGYFEKEENTKGDNPPIGIVLAREKDELIIQYAMNNISSQLFV